MSKIRTQKVGFFHYSSKINNYYFIIFLRRPILDLKFPLMNVADLYPYVAGDTRTFIEGEDPIEDTQWVEQMLVAQPLEVEAILDTKAVKSTRKD